MAVMLLCGLDPRWGGGGGVIGGREGCSSGGEGWGGGHLVWWGSGGVRAVLHGAWWVWASRRFWAGDARIILSICILLYWRFGLASELQLK